MKIDSVINIEKIMDMEENVYVPKCSRSRRKTRRESDNSRKRNALRKERKANKNARLKYVACKRNLEEQAFIANANDSFTMRVAMRMGTRYNALLNEIEVLRYELAAIEVYDPRFLSEKMAKEKVEMEHAIDSYERDLEELLAEMN